MAGLVGNYKTDQLLAIRKKERETLKGHFPKIQETLLSFGDVDCRRICRLITKVVIDFTWLVVLRVPIKPFLFQEITLLRNKNRFLF